MTTAAPIVREEDDWDTMLAGLSIERVRQLLEDAADTLDQIVPVSSGELDPLLGQLRRLLEQLGAHP